MIDLVCLPLHQIDVILGMNWLEYNGVSINCYNKMVRFPEVDDDGEVRFLSARQVGELVKDEAQIFVVFASLQAEGKVVSMDLPVVCEFQDEIGRAHV